MDTFESPRPSENNNDQKQACGRLTERKVTRIVGAVVSGLVLACVIAFVFGFLVKWLWGATLTPLLGVPRLTYWQAVGLIILAKILFGGIGHHHKSADHPFRRPRFHEFPGKNMDFFNFHHRKDFRQYWEKEGKKAFEEYLSKRARPDTQNG
jgi:hypothetical protein